MKHGEPRARTRIFSAVVSTIAAAAVIISCEFIAPGGASNGCRLRYKQPAEERPLLFAVVSSSSSASSSGSGSGLCRIGPGEDGSQTNRHTERKYDEDIRPEEVMGGLNYDAARAELLYWARPANVDHSRLYRVPDNDTLAGAWEQLLEQPDDFREAALDWAARNLYLVMGSRSRLVAVHVPGPGARTPSWGPSVVLEDRGQITALALHPNRGYLFLVETGYSLRGGGAHSRLLRAHLDGSALRELQLQRGYVAELAVDELGERLYWSLPAQGALQHSRLDGSDARQVRGLRLHSGPLELASRALALDRHYLYYLEQQQLVRRLDKLSGAKDDEFELENLGPAISELVVVAPRAQRPSREHPCANAARGGCDKYCFAVPSDNGTGGAQPGALVRVCGCSFGDLLGPDGLSCSRPRPTTAGP